MLMSRRVLAVLIFGVLTAGAVVLSTRVSAAPAGSVTPATVPTPLHPACGYRYSLPPALFRLIIRLLRVNCGNPGAPTTTTTPTTPPADVFGFDGTLKVITCGGTPASPVNCGPPVATGGRVRVDDQVLTTNPDGTFHSSAVGYVDVQGIVTPPPGQYAD